MVRYEAVQKFRSAHSAAPTDTCRSLRTFSATTRMLQRGSFWPALITPSSANRSMNPWGQLRLACKDFLTRANFSRKAKTNAILLSRSRHGLDSGDRRKGRSDPRYLHDERRHSLEARRSKNHPGLEMFAVWGNPNEGASLILQKFPAGMDSGWHWHTAAYQGVVIQGKFTHTFEGAAGQTSGRAWLQVGQARNLRCCFGQTGQIRELVTIQQNRREQGTCL